MKFPCTAVGRAVAACATAATLLTGCGVQKTGVIEVGGPATVMAADPKGQYFLFFLSTEERLTPVVRFSKGYDLPGGTEPVDVPTAITALFAGPQADDRAAGLRTELPKLNGSMGVSTGPGKVRIVLPLAVRPLGKPAVRQLVCTAAFAQGSDGTAEVTVQGEDGALPPARC
ncbi:hypothetical protein ABZ484_01715 [Streptomyces sp. NPDC006393]|uniref:hypothetical protein n=1 Tax=Streptomyces sp. NPDC006393 TaxID=3156763 RepID=UPI00340EEC6B